MSEAMKPGGEPLIRIVHPSDFSKASRVAFAHALKIALQSKAVLEIVHVASPKVGVGDDFYWADFPGVRSTLTGWNILPTGASADEIAKTGLRVKKILNSASDPLESPGFLGRSAR